VRACAYRALPAALALLWSLADRRALELSLPRESQRHRLAMVRGWIRMLTSLCGPVRPPPQHMPHVTGQKILAVASATTLAEAPRSPGGGGLSPPPLQATSLVLFPDSMTNL